jgi:hypothetical protein
MNGDILGAGSQGWDALVVPRLSLPRWRWLFICGQSYLTCTTIIKTRELIPRLADQNL